MPLERIYMNEAKELLGLKSIDAVVSWCKSNTVKVFTERSRKFMCRIEFLTALEKPIIDSLILEFGDIWTEVYDVMITNDTRRLNEYKRLNNKVHRKQEERGAISRYNPKSSIARSFSESLNIGDE